MSLYWLTCVRWADFPKIKFLGRTVMEKVSDLLQMPDFFTRRNESDNFRRIFNSSTLNTANAIKNLGIKQFDEKKIPKNFILPLPGGQFGRLLHCVLTGVKGEIALRGGQNCIHSVVVNQKKFVCPEWGQISQCSYFGCFHRK